MSEKLQKVLARQGLASRREIERWISAGRLQVNGRPAMLGDRVGPHDKIFLDGRRLSISPEEEATTRVLIYHKPEGEVCSREDGEGRPTVFARLPSIKPGRWISVGRLDINTTGLLLLTNDGELAHRLMHPSAMVEREYAVRINGQIDESILKRLTRGVKLPDGMARFEEIVPSNQHAMGANRWYHVVVCEGRHRLVRRLWESQGVQVSRLKRVRYGTIVLPSQVRQGQAMELSKPVIDTLLQYLEERH